MSEFLSASALWAICLTAGAYQLGAWVQKKTRIAALSPILTGAALIILLLIVFKVPNAQYQAGVTHLSFLLTPCTVCFGIPLYKQLDRLKGNLTAIFAGVFAGAASGIFLIAGMCFFFRTENAVSIALLPKSVTTAMAIPLATEAGGLVPLTAAAVILSGILGNVAGEGLCRIAKIKHPIAQGVAFGTASHVAGTAKAAELNELTGAVSSLSLVVAGILTAVLMPFLLPLFA
ncbi:MAG: LrgB family protein [Clostridiales bacterium]|nr:LrgB family protein [Clostridiales bacterium]